VKFIALVYKLDSPITTSEYIEFKGMAVVKLLTCKLFRHKQL